MAVVKILAVDLGHVFRRQWEAKSEEDLGAPLKSTLAIVARLREGFDRVAVCCDGGPSWRRSILPEYKGNRIPAGAPYYEALRRCEERLAADGCHVFKGPVLVSEPGSEELCAEADDVIASLASWAYDLPEGTIESVRIVSGDKDLLALVNDGSVDVQRFDLPGEPVWTSADVMTKHSVPPDRVTQWLALGGDLSDNFKAFPGWEERDPKDPNGVIRKPGIAGKTAANLLAKFGNIEGIFTALESRDEKDEPIIKGHVAEVLARGGRAAAELGMRLATLRADLPIDFAPLLAEKPVAPIATPEKRFTPEPPDEVIGEPVPPAPTPPPQSVAMARVETSALAPYALEPRSLGELETLALIAFNSRAYNLANMEQAMMCMLEARERGIPVGTALRGAYNVKGKLAWSASYLAGLVLSSCKADYFEIVETTPTQATVAYKRVGRPGGTFTFTLEEARIAGWIKSGERGDSKWVTNPRTMLRWAAIRECARALFPDVVSGMYTPDELREGHVTDAEWEQAS